MATLGICLNRGHTAQNGVVGMFNADIFLSKSSLFMGKWLILVNVPF